MTERAIPTPKAFGEALATVPRADHLRTYVCPVHGDLTLVLCGKDGLPFAAAIVPCGGIPALVEDVLDGVEAYGAAEVARRNASGAKPQ